MGLLRKNKFSVKKNKFQNKTKTEPTRQQPIWLEMHSENGYGFGKKINPME